MKIGNIVKLKDGIRGTNTGHLTAVVMSINEYGDVRLNRKLRGYKYWNKTDLRRVTDK